jgi:hypothetical protein
MYNEEAAQIKKLHTYAKEIGLPPTKIRLSSWLEANYFISAEGEVLHSSYATSHSPQDISKELARYRRNDPRSYVITSFLGGLYDPEISTIFLNDRDGLSLRKAAHELAHVFLHQEPSNIENRALNEAFAETLGLIALANEFLGQESLNDAHLAAYRQAIEEQTPLSIDGESLEVLVNDVETFDIATRIALSKRPLAERFTLARELLSE